MTPSFLIFLLILDFVHSRDEEKGFFKFYEPDLGRDCQPGEEGIEPGIKYYYDEADMTYFPFWYKGCGGDPENRFDEPAGSSLDIPDHYVCPGIPRSHSACKTGNSREEEEKCPEGYYCQQGWEWRFGSSSGDCCSKVNQKLALQDWEASKCKKEGLRPVVSKELRRGVAILMGRKCEHSFCPPHLSSCRQGNFRAYCCRNQIKDIF